MSRTTQAEVLKRREEVRELIIQATPSKLIVDSMSEKWHTSRRAISEDIKVIYKQWKERAQEHQDLTKNKYLDRLEMLFSEAMGKENYRIALEVQKELHKLTGMYSEKKTENEAPKIITLKEKKPGLSVVENDEKAENG